VSTKSWYQKSSRVRIVLVPALSWCQHFSGTRIPLVSYTRTTQRGTITMPINPPTTASLFPPITSMTDDRKASRGLSEAWST
jgi:hypothetical protein